MSLAATRRVSAREDLLGVLPAALLTAIGASLAIYAVVHPARVVLVVVAAALIVLGAVRPVVPLAAFLVSIPLEYGWQISGNETLTVTKLAGLLCFASFAVFAARTRRSLRADRSHVLVLALLCLALASTAQAQSPSAGMTTTIRYLSWALLYFVITQFAGEPRTMRVLVWSLVLSAGIAGVWGCLDFISGRTPLATLPHGQQNDYAFVLTSILFLSVWLVRRERTFGKVVAATSAACILAGIGLSLSRGAWLALSVATAFYCVAHRRQAKGLLVLAVLGAVAVAGFVAVDPGRVQEGASMKQAVAQKNVDSRLTLWRGAITLAAEHPLLGIGPGNFGEYYYVITGNPSEVPPLTAAHQTYLEVAAELGPLGLLVFLGFMLLIARRLNEAIHTGAGPPELALFLRLSLIAIAVGFLTVSEEFFAPVWLIAGLSTLAWLERPSVSST